MDTPYQALCDALKNQGYQGDISDTDNELNRCSYDEGIFAVRPKLVLAPKTRGDIEIIVRVLREHSPKGTPLSLTPRAAASGLGGGSLNDSIIIDVTKHLSYLSEPQSKAGSIYLEAEPGVWYRDIEKLLKPMTRYLPSYPASKDICCVGGMIGNNCAGPTSLTTGHFVEYVESLDVVLQDGNTYTLRPWSYSILQEVIAHDNELGRITKEIWKLLEKHEKLIQESKPGTKKNTAGYPLWDVLSTSVAEFKAGTGTFNLIRIFAGSQGTLGVITNATLKTEVLPEEKHLFILPVFDLHTVGKVLKKTLDWEPYTLELFDKKTFHLALRNPGFFNDRLPNDEYPNVLNALYQTYFDRFCEQVPEFIILASFTKELSESTQEEIVEVMHKKFACDAFQTSDHVESEMYWQIRRASYTLSKFQDTSKRPAAFLEDMIVPPERLSAFFEDIQKLFEKYEVEAAVHGHGGNGHLHFYPLLDFTDPKTADKVLAMSDEFFDTAVSHDGGICGEHNDGIVRTPYLDKMYSKETLDLFKKVEHIFDPQDLFNPGKKVNAKFDLKKSMRKVN